MIKTKNFNPATDPKLLCTCGHKDCDRRSVNQFSLDRAQLIRDDIGKPLVITSGGRCPNHPNEVTKQSPGDHGQCYALDVACNNLQDETKIKVLAGRRGATRVAGTYKDGFVHIAWTPTSRTDVPTWSY
jgi:hypothetical protein